MSKEDGFLGRWSRRKASARKEAGSEEPPVLTRDGRGEAPAEGRAAPADAPAERDAAPAESTPDLPGIESLGPKSDFSAFMRADVPDALRRQALRKLWRLDPAFSKLDGLVEYGEDYNAAARRPGVVTTAWRIGRGMAGREAPGAKDGDGAEPQEAPSAQEEECRGDGDPDGGPGGKSA
jgi:hypothetical protein